MNLKDAPPPFTFGQIIQVEEGKSVRVLRDGDRPMYRDRDGKLCFEVERPISPPPTKGKTP